MQVKSLELLPVSIKNPRVVSGVSEITKSLKGEIEFLGTAIQGLTGHVNVELDAVRKALGIGMTRLEGQIRDLPARFGALEDAIHQALHGWVLQTSNELTKKLSVMAEALDAANARIAMLEDAIRRYQQPPLQQQMASNTSSPFTPAPQQQQAHEDPQAVTQITVSTANSVPIDARAVPEMNQQDSVEFKYAEPQANNDRRPSAVRSASAGRKKAIVLRPVERQDRAFVEERPAQIPVVSQSIMAPRKQQV